MQTEDQPLPCGSMFIGFIDRACWLNPALKLAIGCCQIPVGSISRQSGSILSNVPSLLDEQLSDRTKSLFWSFDILLHPGSGLSHLSISPGFFVPISLARISVMENEEILLFILLAKYWEKKKIIICKMRRRRLAGSTTTESLRHHRFYCKQISSFGSAHFSSVL